MAEKKDEAEIVEAREPIHEWFELSYASYLVLPRSVLQSAPQDWQQRFVACLEELEQVFGNVPERGSYAVQLRSAGGKFMADPLAGYERGRRRIAPRAEVAQVDT